MGRTSCCATRGFHGWFAWKYWWQGCSRCGDENRRSVRLVVEPFDPRESPTSLLFSSSITASLFAMHAPVPSMPEVSQTQTSFAPISVASGIEAESDVRASGVVRASTVVRGSPDPAPAVSTTSAQKSDAPHSSAENWVAFSAVDDFFSDPLALDPSLGTKPHSGGPLSAGASDDARPHGSGGGSESGGGGGFSAGNTGASSGGESIGSVSPQSASGGSVATGVPRVSNVPSNMVANASGLGHPGSPTNVVLAQTIPLTTGNGPVTPVTPPLTTTNSPTNPPT